MQNWQAERSHGDPAWFVRTLSTISSYWTVFTICLVSLTRPCNGLSCLRNRKSCINVFGSLSQAHSWTQVCHKDMSWGSCRSHRHISPLGNVQEVGSCLFADDVQLYLDFNPLKSARMKKSQHSISVPGVWEMFRNGRLPTSSNWIKKQDRVPCGCFTPLSLTATSLRYQAVIGTCRHHPIPTCPKPRSNAGSNYRKNENPCLLGLR